MRISEIFQALCSPILVACLVTSSAFADDKPKFNLNPCAKEHASVTFKRSDRVRICAETPGTTPVTECGLVVSVTVPKNSAGVRVSAQSPGNKKDCESRSVKLTAYKKGIALAHIATKSAKGKWDAGGTGGGLENPYPCSLASMPILQLAPGDGGAQQTYRVIAVQKGTPWNCVELQLESTVK